MTSEDKEMVRQLIELFPNIQCPLCMEPMEADDLAFFPCDCRYQICRFCWTKIINEENGLCPACRKEYNSEKPASYKPVTDPDDTRGKPNKKRKDYLKKTKLSPEMLKILPDLRVVQPNLIFVVGLPTSICKQKDILKGQDYFGRYGKIYKVEINQNQTFGGPQGQQSFSAYITFHRAEDAMRSIRELNQSTLHGRPIRVSLGTTKYCSQFLRGAKCTKHECMYLHELGDPAASFTKEEMQAGKHTEYMNKLLSEYSQSTSTTNTRHDMGATDCTNLDPSVTCEEENPLISTFMKESDIHNNPGEEEVNSRSVNASKLSSSSRNGTYSSHTTDPRSPRSAVGDGRKIRQMEKNYQNVNHNPDCKISNNVNGNNNNCADTNVSVCWNQPSSTANHTSSYINKKPLRNQALNPLNMLSNPKSEKSNTDNGILNKTDNQQTHNSRGVILSNPVQSWYHSASTSTSTKHRVFNDDNIDIDFDPFRESQQGLAELLAAEIAQLDVGDTASSRLNCEMNGHLNPHVTNVVDIANKSYNAFLESNLLENIEHGYNTVQSKGQNYPWFSNCIQSDKESHSSLNHSNPLHSSSYAPTVYPPPGFEEATKGRQASPDVPLFSSSNPGSQLDSRFADSSCPVYPNNADYNNTSLSNSNGPYSLDVKANSLIEKPGAIFPGFENWFQNKACSKGSNHIPLGDSTNFHPSSVVSSEFPNSFKSDQPLQSQQQQQLMANIFAAAFNTASAMLNSSSSGSSDKSQGRPFDLNLFFDQLCRQSSLFSSLNNHNLQSQPEWQNNFNNRSNTNQSDDFLDATATAVTAAACALFPSSKYPSRSDFQGNETFSPQDPYARCAPGRCLSKLSIHPQSTAAPDVFQDNGYTCASASDIVLDHETGSSMTWQLDDPAIVSSRLSSKMWRPGSNHQQYFDPNLLPPFSPDTGNGNFHPQQPPPSTSSQHQQQLLHQSQQPRDPVLQSSSHPQPTD